MATTKYNTLAILVSAAVLSLAGMPQAIAADYSGTFKGTFSKQEPLPIPDKDNHAIVLGSSAGTNKSTGKNSYMDDAEIVVKDFVDLVNGNGAHEGYITFAKDGEQVTNKLVGKVTTVLAPDGKTPMTTIEGTFEQIYGTNLYGTLHPVGTWKVKFLSPTEYVCDWEVTRFN